MLGKGPRRGSMLDLISDCVDYVHGILQISRVQGEGSLVSRDFANLYFSPWFPELIGNRIRQVGGWHPRIVRINVDVDIVRVVYSCSQSAGARSNMADDSRRQAATVVR